VRFPAYRQVKFGGVLEGSRWLWMEGETERVKLEEGDFYLLIDGLPYCFASDLSVEVMDGEKVLAENLGADGIVRYGRGETRTVRTGGRFTFDDDMSELFLKFLPRSFASAPAPSTPDRAQLLTGLDLKRKGRVPVQRRHEEASRT